MLNFTYQSLPARVRFGRGTIAELGGELEKLGCDKVILVTSAPQSEDADRLREQIGGACAGVFKRAAMHTPTDVTQEALAEVVRPGAAGVVAIGGGSALGLSKAIQFPTDPPQIMISPNY